MAYVAISNGLVESTHSNIRKMCNAEKATRTAPPESIPARPDDAQLELLVWGDHLALRDQLPNEWKQTISKLVMRIEYEHAPEQTSSVSLVHTFTAPMEVPCRKDDNNISYYGYQVKVPEASHLLCPEARELVEHRKFCLQTDKKWEDIWSQVSQFLRAAKSLNEALKLWPALALYIDKDYIDRVNTNVKREKTISSAEELLAKLSTDDITAAAVAHKLSV